MINESSKRQIRLIPEIEFQYTEDETDQAVLQGIALDDIDNDGRYECIIGTKKGKLSILRSNLATQQVEEWLSCEGLGTISVVLCSNITNGDIKSILVFTIEGKLHYFQIHAQDQLLKPLQTISIVSNVSCVLLLPREDKRQLILGTRSNLILFYDLEIQDNMWIMHINDQFRVSGEVESLSIQWTNHTKQMLLIGLYDGKCMEYELNQHEIEDQHKIENEITLSSIDLIHSTSIQMKTQISKPTHSNYISFASMEGRISLYDYKNKQTCWQARIMDPILSLKKVNLYQSQQDEMVVCTWNGSCYVYDIDGNSIQFQASLIPTCAFEIGLFTFPNGQTKLSFFFIATNGYIQIYSDLAQQIDSIQYKPFIKQIEKCPFYSQLQDLETLQMLCEKIARQKKNGSNAQQEKNSLAKLIRDCFY